MKIENKTNYDTRYLRRLFLACEKYQGTNPKYQMVKVSYARGNRIRAEAWYNCYGIYIRLPKNYRGHSITSIPRWASGEGRRRLTEAIKKQKEKYPIEPIPARELAQIYIHELCHNQGLHHKDMEHWWDIDVSWLPDETIPLKVEKPAKPKPNIIVLRAAKAQKKLDEWQKKLKRAKTHTKKYRTKVKYYEKKMAAIPKGS